MTNKLTHGSLFSGIGGFDLAAEWSGWENIFHCEWNSFGQKILKYYWPNSISYEDITKTDFTVHRGTIDVLTGGFPCQPYSVAGKRKGKADERHLWPEMLRAIREIQPSYVVGENVGGIVNWSGGLVFDEVQTDLENEGYEIQPFILPACAKNAPHRRDRVWFIAYSDSFRNNRSNEPTRDKNEGEQSQNNKQSGNRGASKTERLSEERIITNSDIIGRREGFSKDVDNNGIRKTTKQIDKRSDLRNRDTSIGGTGISSDTSSERFQRSSGEELQRGKSRLTRNNSKLTIADTYSGRQPSEEYREKKSRFTTEKSFSGNFENFPTQSPICSGNDGISSRLDFDSVFEGIDKPRKPITFSKWRNESIKGYGNAIVPQIALEIFKAIQKHNNLINNL